MNGRVARYVLLDSGFWIGLLDPSDGRHNDAGRIYKKIEDFHVVVPWPTLYEFVNTRLAQRSANMARLAAALRLPGVKRLDDGRYREAALAGCLDAGTAERPMSLVDRILRGVLADVGHVHVDAFAHFNPRDFSDAHRLRRGLKVIDATE